MSARYRLIHFTPDPYSGSRVPLAALLEAHQQLTLIVPEGPLTASDWGGGQGAALAELLRQSLSDVTDFERLPPSLGPHALLDVAHPLPPQVQDPISWLRGMLYPSRNLRAAG